MNEREPMRMGRDAGGEAREERLRSLLQAAFPAAEPDEALERTVAELVARHTARGTRRRQGWRLPFVWRPAMATAAAAALLVALGVMVAGKAYRHPMPGTTPQVAGAPHSPRSAPEQRLVRLAPHERRSRQLALANPPQAGRDESIPGLSTPPTRSTPQRLARNHRPASLPEPRASPAEPRAEVQDDMAYLNGDAARAIQPWLNKQDRQSDRIEVQVRHRVRVKDDFVTIPFPEIASTSIRQIVRAVESYKREAAVVDSRLFHKVSLAFKGASLDNLCAALQAQAGVPIRAARGVGDDKVTVFVENRPARDVMRAIVQLFGYTWSRTRMGDRYQYELLQDLRSQLAEEAMRQQDMSAALLALDRAMQAYRPYMALSLDEMKARLQHARADEKDRLANLVDGAWVGVQLYERLTPAERVALLTGQPLVFSFDAAQPDRRLPPGWVQPLTWPSGARPVTVSIQLDRADLGRLVLGETINLQGPGEHEGGRSGSRLADCAAPSMDRPDNAAANQALCSQRPFSRVVSIQPRPSCTRVSEYRLSRDKSSLPPAFTSDVWEAVHHTTGLPIVADFYSHRYLADAVKVEHASLFDALCRVGDAMGVRWRKQGDFLLCRSTTFLWDRLKEVPNRYLVRWQREKKEYGGLPLDALLEMASLSDDQLSATDMGYAIVDCWDLPEWKIVASWFLTGGPITPGVAAVRPSVVVRTYSNRDPRLTIQGWQRNPPNVRPEVRFLSTLTPAQRKQVLQPDGIAFAALSTQQQRGFLQLWEQAEDFWEQRTGHRSSLDPQQFVNARFSAWYIPAGWYYWYHPELTQRLRPVLPVTGRTRAEVIAAGRLDPNTDPRLIPLCRDGIFAPSLWIGVVPNGETGSPGAAGAAP